MLVLNVNCSDHAILRQGQGPQHIADCRNEEHCLLDRPHPEDSAAHGVDQGTDPGRHHKEEHRIDLHTLGADQAQAEDVDVAVGQGLGHVDQSCHHDQGE